MICLILAAGYATRLYPLTENFPKPLLKVGDKTILDYLVDDIDSSKKVSSYVVISNHKFYKHFTDWADKKPQNITVLDDGTETNETRLGAVKDIRFAINSLKLCDDMLVIAGDNLLDFSLCDFIDYAEKKDASALMRYYEPDFNKLLKCGVVTVDGDDKILNMTEKSKTPETNFCTPPFYFYKKEDALLIGEAIADGCATDAPGSFISWLCKRKNVYAMEMTGRRFDVGNLESYQKISKEYRGINNVK